MDISKRILFLYISISSGHQRSAEAIMGAVQKMNPRVDNVGLDSFHYEYPVIGRLIARTYLEILKYTPQIWEYLYDNPKVAAATKEVRELLNVLNSRKAYRLLTKHRPLCVVCTQAVPMTTLAAMKGKGKIRLPLIGVVTDFDVHSYWLSRHVDLYIVATDDIKRKMVREGIRENRVLVTGIPVDPHFAVIGDKTAERAKLGLNPFKPTVLVMGGSRGLGPLVEVVGTLRRLQSNAQVIAVCGQNRAAWKELTAEFKHDRAVRVFGFVRNLHRLMDAADLLISKPGGMTCAESMAKGLPLVMINPIPGQEERNAKYLLKNGVAERVGTLDDMARTVHHLLTHKNRLEKLRVRSLEMSRPNAAYDAAEAILRLIKAPVLFRPHESVERQRLALSGMV